MAGCRRIEIKAAAASRSAPRREKDPKKRVVITGMGCVSVFGTDVNVFHDKLLQGTSGVSLIDRFDASSFPKINVEKNELKEGHITWSITKVDSLFAI
jgi:3-oxoacyl-(acyl-carrier-protein) synthase